MSTDIHPDWRTGKLCYLELPSEDPAAAAEFYRTVFGWRIRHRDDGSLSFDDVDGGISGTFVTGRPPFTDPGLILYVMVADAAAVLAAVDAGGGRLVRATPPGHSEV